MLRPSPPEKKARRTSSRAGAGQPAFQAPTVIAQDSPAGIPVATILPSGQQQTHDSTTAPPLPASDDTDAASGQATIAQRKHKQSLHGPTYTWDNAAQFKHLTDDDIFAGAVHPHDICGSLLMRLSKAHSNKDMAQKINALWLRLGEKIRDPKGNNVTKALSKARKYFAEQAGIILEEAFKQQNRERAQNGVNYSMTAVTSQGNKHWTASASNEVGSGANCSRSRRTRTSRASNLALLADVDQSNDNTASHSTSDQNQGTMHPVDGSSSSHSTLENDDIDYEEFLRFFSADDEDAFEIHESE